MTTTSWCLSGKLPLAAAQQLESLIETIADERGDFPPTLSYFEIPKEPEWQVEIFFPEAPDYGLITQLLLQAGLEDWEHEIAPLEDKDWVSESQKLLAPVEAGQFLVFGSHDADKAQAGKINLQIDAGQAFGTGKHETTAACLEALTLHIGGDAPKKVLDLGTGSAVLALAAHKLWPTATVTASDIDPIAIDVARTNLTVNKTLERGKDNQAGIRLLVADGLNDPAFAEEKPFDLILANILAGPLVEMAGDISASLTKEGSLILSGLLVTQEKEVLDAYKARGLISQGRIEIGDWLALILKSK